MSGFKRKSKLPHRPFAKIADVHAGTILIADGGFTCIKEGARLTVRENGSIPAELYVMCRDDRHYLDGQIEGDEYVGLYLAEGQ